MAEDSGGQDSNDLGTAYYRSRDPIKNLKIKVHLKRVTGTSLVPTAFGNDEAGPSQEGMALRPMGSKHSIKSQARPEDNEIFTFKWQQKLFSSREVDLYRDMDNCTRPVEEKYHREITALYEGDGKPTARLFSYVDHDSFASIEEQNMVTTSCNETPTFLTKKMENVRRRKQTDRRRDGYGQANSFQPKMNPVVEDPSDEHKRSAHVINTPVQTMYIMADLSSVEDESTILDEYILCTIKYDTHGVLSLTPDFNHHRSPYTIVTESTRRDTFEYTVQLASQAMGQRDQDREAKMFRELYQRHVDYMGAMVGHDFEQVISGILRLLVYGEIISAKNYEYDNLYVHFFVELPKHWSADRSQQLSGVTQTCSTKEINRENVAYFSYPFDVELCYRHEEVGQDGDNPELLPQWPQIFLEVLSIDTWQRYRTEGYGYLTIPSKPGIHTIEVQTWRPCGRNVFDNMRRFFIGGSPELEDPTYISVPPTHEGAVMSRFGFQTEATGSVKVKLNLLQQSQIFMEKSTSKKKVGTLLDRLGGLTMQASVQNVLELFQKARKRMQAAKETLSTIQ
ncbi:Meckel syndrome type 1 protein-like [Asterias rubens]|uniref:Meckel syndrome type 1 protein-like n=1 Tax=Asterias rubens TaxID=7604 RepID=UPI001455BB23|nr:Meckel syndrome type 1 protein-like [Asterias rubens]